MSERLERAAPAKINLALHVTGRRADGYHLLESLVVFTRHGDRLWVEPAERDSFSVTGPYSADVPLTTDNLVLRARDLMRREFGTNEPVALILEKNLPVAAGIGGGSSNAAAAMQLLTEHWRISDTASLPPLGLRLGADVPMCMAARSLVARGVGERLEPVHDLPALALVLVNPGVPVATPQVFAALEKRDNSPLPPLRHGGEALQIADWLSATRNDLEKPALALVPEIGAALNALRTHGARLARMSGSGATCFGLFENESHAQAAASALANRQPQWFVQATATVPSLQEIENV